MLGMHGTWEANHAMHDCDLMICLGARFDDRVHRQGQRLLAGLEEDPPRHRCLADQQDRARRSAASSPMPAKALREMIRFWKAQKHQVDRPGAEGLVGADRQLAGASKSLAYRNLRHADQAAICHRPAV